MRDIDKKALKAKSDKAYLEEFINEFEVFILHTAHKGAGKYVSKMDDQWSVALSAFHEAIQAYDFEKGSFLSFAETVIRRRLYDDNRKWSRYDCEIPIDSYTIENEMEDNFAVKREVMTKFTILQSTDSKMEIEAITGTLREYGFSFFDLVKVSPKAQKTKIACAKAILYLCQNPILLTEMQMSKNLPLKVIEKKCDVPRKVLERHRKYIIAGAEIISGDYPILSEYLRFVREEMTK